MDQDNKDALFKLLRFNSKNTNQKKLISLDEYVDKMKEGQQKIYFIVNAQYDAALNSPFMESFKNSDLDVLILTNNVDEILFQQNGEYKGKRVVNIESNFEEI